MTVLADVPVLLCDQAPVDSGPLLLERGDPCPFCGTPIEDHDTDPDEPRP